MDKARQSLGVFLALLCVLNLAVASVRSSPEEQRFNLMLKAERDTLGLPSTQRMRVMEETYENLFPGSADTDPTQLSDAELGFNFRSTYIAAHFSRRLHHFAILSAQLSELESRGASNEDQRRKLHETMMALRLFEKADEYRARHPDLGLPAIPEIVTSKVLVDDGPLVYRVHRSDFKLIRDTAPIKDGIRIVAVVHPSCNPSRRALSDIMLDRRIWPAVRNVTQWMTPQGARLDFQLLQKWNREHSEVEIKIPDSVRDWPMLTDWSTPHFYLLKDGEVVDEFMGWPSDGGNQQRLLELLGRGGLI